MTTDLFLYVNFSRSKNLHGYVKSYGCWFKVRFDNIQSENMVYHRNFRFFRSANNVILSPGDSNGIIQPEFFSKVKNVKTNQIIFSAESQNWKVPDVKLLIHVSSTFVISDKDLHYFAKYICFSVVEFTMEPK